MISYERAALMCPISDEEKVLMIRRRYFDEKWNAPERFPGEWTFAGGHHSLLDNNLYETAEREFREETGYEGGIISPELFFVSEPVLDFKQYLIHFYAAELESEEGPFKMNDEVIDLRWFNPTDAISMIKSDDFEAELLGEYSRLGLGNEKYGIRRITARQFPFQTLNTLEVIANEKRRTT